MDVVGVCDTVVNVAVGDGRRGLDMGSAGVGVDGTDEMGIAGAEVEDRVDSQPLVGKPRRVIDRTREIVLPICAGRVCINVYSCGGNRTD